MKFSMYLIFITPFLVINSMEKKPNLSEQPDTVKKALQFNFKCNNENTFSEIVEDIKQLNPAQKQALFSKAQLLPFTKNIAISSSKETNQ